MKFIAENLIIYGTSETPEIVFLLDGSFIMRGRSVPDDPDYFYIPIVRYLENFEQLKKNVFFTFHLDYYNTSSFKWLTRIFTILQEISKHNKVVVKWEYLDIDEDLKEVGEELKDMFKIDMKLIEIKTERRKYGI
jgi:hypothetical protein